MYKKNKKTALQKMVILALLTACEIVLSRFLSVSMWNIKLGFSFIPIVVAAWLFGPVESALVAGLADFLGAIMFPIGTYFPAFTLTAVITGAVYGIFIHKQGGFLKILASIVINQFILSLFVNTLWISILYGSPYIGLLPVRALQTVAMSIVQAIIIPSVIAISKRLSFVTKV